MNEISRGCGMLDGYGLFEFNSATDDTKEISAMR